MNLPLIKIQTGHMIRKISLDEYHQLVHYVHIQVIELVDRQRKEEL